LRAGAAQAHVLQVLDDEAGRQLAAERGRAAAGAPERADPAPAAAPPAHAASAAPGGAPGAPRGDGPSGAPPELPGGAPSSAPGAPGGGSGVALAAAAAATAAGPQAGEVVAGGAPASSRPAEPPLPGAPGPRCVHLPHPPPAVHALPQVPVWASHQVKPIPQPTSPVRMSACRMLRSGVCQKLCQTPALVPRRGRLLRPRRRPARPRRLPADDDRHRRAARDRAGRRCAYGCAARRLHACPPPACLPAVCMPARSRKRGARRSPTP